MLQHKKAFVKIEDLNSDLENILKLNTYLLIKNFVVKSAYFNSKDELFTIEIMEYQTFDVIGENRILCKIRPEYDERFQNCGWSKCFIGEYGLKISLNTYLEIVKYLFKIDKLEILI